jgi:hypothetical protein
MLATRGADRHSPPMRARWEHLRAQEPRLGDLFVRSLRLRADSLACTFPRSDGS